MDCYNCSGGRHRQAVPVNQPTQPQTDRCRTGNAGIERNNTRSSDMEAIGAILGTSPANTHGGMGHSCMPMPEMSQPSTMMPGMGMNQPGMTMPGMGMNQPSTMMPGMEMNQPGMTMPGMGMNQPGMTMPQGGCQGSVRCPGSVIGNIEGCPVGIGYVPWQQWKQPYNMELGLERGTIFPELDLPFEKGRCR